MSRIIDAVEAEIADTLQERASSGTDPVDQR